MNKITFLFLLITGFITAQNPTSTSSYNSKNSKVDISELKATAYPKDSLAHALYIFEKGYSRIDPSHDYNLLTSYEAKIKILDKEGIEEATIEIPLSASYKTSKKEKLYDLKASTYKLKDGKLLKKTLSENNIYIENHENYELVKFTFPDVEPGDILVYSYDLVSPFLFDFTTWYFQEGIPKIHSEFTARIPGNYEYYVTLVGEQKLSVNDAKAIEDCIRFGASSMAGCVETHYVMENIPAFKGEDFMTSEANFKSKIKFELKQITQLDGFEKKFTKSWEDVDKELKSSKGLGKQWRKDGLVADLLPQDIQNLPNNLEKARKIYHFVQENYKWNGEYQIHRDMNLKDIIDKHSGNVLAVNTLLHNLYSEEGFEVYPVMASTRNHGFPTRVHPVLSDFNYFFVQLDVEGEYFNLDATGENLDFGRLPFRALNSYARKIDLENGSSWIDIHPQDYSMISYRDSLKINADGTAKGYSEQVLTGYHALNFRDYKKNNSEQEVFDEVSKPNDFTVATKTEYQNLDDNEAELHIRYDLSNKSQKINDLIYFNPFSFKFFKNNPFNLDERNYPIDFGYKDAYMYSAIIEIPEGYTVTDLPQTKALKMPNNGGSLIFSTQKISENILTVQCKLTFPQAVYTSNYYNGLKKFFSEIMAVQSQSVIVLREKA